MSLDATDRAIVERLQRDGRMPFTQIAHEVGLTEGAIRKRVQRLTDSGFMQVVAVTDPVSSGDRTVAMVGVRVTGDTERTAKALAKLDEVEYLIAVAGRYDLMFEVIVDSGEELMRLLSKLRSRTDIVEAESFPVLKLFKQSFAWGP